MNATGKYNRLQSLDIFRGLTVCCMIVVGASGNYDYTYRMLDHAPWSGFTPTDLIFPSFLFIVGLAQSLSFKTTTGPATAAGEGHSRLWKILKRTILLYAIGIGMNWFPFCFRAGDGSIQWIPIEQLRILGVLQRIALTYGISSLLELYLSERILIKVGALILTAYVIILNTAGGPAPYDPSSNVVGQIDRLLFGPDHIYREQGVPFDPEGLLSTLPAIVSVLGGFLTGRRLLRQPFDPTRLLKGMMTGCTLLMLGYLWSYFDPVNKKLWTTSFTLVTMGLDIMLFIMILYWTDIRQQRFAATSFFTSLGKNPILIYLFAELLMKLLLFPAKASRQTLYASLYAKAFSSAGMYLGSLLQALAYMLLCGSLAWFLNKKKLYLKI